MEECYFALCIYFSFHGNKEEVLFSEQPMCECFHGEEGGGEEKRAEQRRTERRRGEKGWGGQRKKEFS